MSNSTSSNISNSQIKKSQSWRTLVININSAPGKRAELENLINYTDPDLIIMTETKIDVLVKASEFLPKGYTGDIRKDRCKGGGGVMIATKQEYGLVQIQKDFTRKDKILDLLCTNKPDLFSDIRSIPGISDHEIILADCDLKPVVCKKPSRTTYLWIKVDWYKICLLASKFSESFLPEHGTRSVDKNYTMFKEFIALTMKEHIPNKLTSTRTNLPWFNRGLKRMCKVKRRRFKRAKK